MDTRTAAGPTLEPLQTLIKGSVGQGCDDLGQTTFITNAPDRVERK